MLPVADLLAHDTGPAVPAALSSALSRDVLRGQRP